MNKLKKVTQGDIPAPATLEYIKDNDKNMSELKEEINLTKQAVINLTENTKNDKKENSNQHASILEGQDKIFDRINCLEEKFASREEFHFWRNVLIAGILLSIFIGVISIMLDRFSK